VVLPRSGTQAVAAHELPRVAGSAGHASGVHLAFDQLDDCYWQIEAWCRGAAEPPAWISLLSRMRAAIDTGRERAARESTGGS